MSKRSNTALIVSSITAILSIAFIFYALFSTTGCGISNNPMCGFGEGIAIFGVGFPLLIISFIGIIVSVLRKYYRQSQILSSNKEGANETLEQLSTLGAKATSGNK
jgi:hypothetical protein